MEACQSRLCAAAMFIADKSVAVNLGRTSTDSIRVASKSFLLARLMIWFVNVITSLRFQVLAQWLEYVVWAVMATDRFAV